MIMTRSRRRHGLRMARVYTSCVLAAAYPGAALAQSAASDAQTTVTPDDAPVDQAPAESGSEGDIIVTATRARSGFSAPTPTQIVSAAELQERGATNIANIIQEVPAFGTKNTREGNGGRPS